MDGRPHGIQMTPTGGGPKYLRTLCWQGTYQCSAFFVPCGYFLIAYDSKSCRGNTLVSSNPTLSVLSTSAKGRRSL